MPEDPFATRVPEAERSRSSLFTVRVWQEDEGEGETAWRGHVQHVVSGQMRYFQDWPALLEFLMAQSRGEDAG